MKTFSFCPPRFQGWRLLSFFNIVAYPSSDALSWDMSSQKLAVATSLSTVSRLLNHWNIFALNCLLPDGGDDSWLRVFWQFNLWKILIQFNEFNKFFDSSATSKAKIFRWNWKYQRNMALLEAQSFVSRIGQVPFNNCDKTWTCPTKKYLTQVNVTKNL